MWRNLVSLPVWPPPHADPETKLCGWVLYWSIIPGSRREDRRAKEGKQSQHKAAWLIQSLLWARGCLIPHRPSGKPYEICLRLSIQRYIYAPAPISHQAKSTPQGISPTAFQVALEQPLPIPHPLSQLRVILPGPVVRCCQVALVWNWSMPLNCLEYEAERTWCSA